MKLGSRRVNECKKRELRNIKGGVLNIGTGVINICGGE